MIKRTVSRSLEDPVEKESKRYVMDKLLGDVVGDTGNKTSSTTQNCPSGNDQKNTRESLDRLYKLQDTKHSGFLIRALDIIQNNVSGTLRIHKIMGSVVTLFV